MFFYQDLKRLGNKVSIIPTSNLAFFENLFTRLKSVMTDHPNRSNRHSRSTGFALVLALLFMSFSVLLLLSMAVLLQVEILAAESNLQTLQTRESARLALMLAIGQLQECAGPDQRVTARADILGDGQFDPYTQFWTGVWDTTQPNAAPRWLVSGNYANPNNFKTKHMQLVGCGSVGLDTTQHVHAPAVAVFDENQQVVAEIAWWVSAEGLKASIAPIPLQLRTPSNFTNVISSSALSIMLSTSHGLEDLFTNYDRFTSSSASTLNRITNLNQLDGQSDFKDRSQWELCEENRFHAVTPFSLGVLASVLPDGGLMQDISLFPQLIGTEFESILERATNSAGKNSTDNTSAQRRRQFSEMRGLGVLGTLKDGQIAEPITPVLSNLMIGFSVHLNQLSDPRLYLRMRFFCELWNPFTSSLMLKDAAGNPLDLELEISGLPTVRLTKGPESSPKTAVINLQKVIGNDSYGSDSPLVITLKNGFEEDWLPGQSKNWTGVNADERAGCSPYESVITDSKQWNLHNRTLGGARGIDTQVDLAGSSYHTLDSDEASLLQIKLYAKNPALQQRSLLCQLENIRYEPITTLPRSPTNKGVNFGYHIILRGPDKSSAHSTYFRGLWLKDHDPRNPQPHFHTDWNLDVDPTFQTGSPYVPVKNGIAPLLSPLPEEIHEGGTIHFPIFRRLCDRSRPHFNKLWQNAPLFELPRERPLSLASLQHLYFHNERPNKVGNSWGDRGAINTLEWFDRYYLSGLSRTDKLDHCESTVDLPNPILVSDSFQDLESALIRWQAAGSDDITQSRELAGMCLVSNRFNINSTSVAAWKAVLGGLRIHQWEYLDYPNNTADLAAITLSKDSRARMFSRFTHTLSETYKAPQTPAFQADEPIAPSAFYRRGARYFDADQINALAHEIVQQIKNRGTPFQSMESFLSEVSPGNGSLMEQAIATIFAPNGRQKWDHRWETEGTRGPESDYIDIDHFAPGFLTQADIMTAIGPMLAPRSDTFKIRARGQSFYPNGTLCGSATIEATLQRLPEAINLNTAINQPTTRRFQLLATRWLLDDQL
jgi:hypothetical protein